MICVAMLMQTMQTTVIRGNPLWAMYFLLTNAQLIERPCYKNTMALSIIEAECMTTAKGIKEIMWLIGLFAEFSSK